MLDKPWFEPLMIALAVATLVTLFVRACATDASAHGGRTRPCVGHVEPCGETKPVRR